jgi:inorganic pyrophosphatase
MNFGKLITCLLFLLTFSCNKKVDYYHLPLFSSDKNINAVIEIPAGTNKKFEFDNESKSFEIDKKNGENRIIKFLPYLGNYGFIPSTYSDPKTGGDGDALDILVLSESVATGTIMETIPIAMLKLIDKGEIDYKIIAIPSDRSKQIIRVKDYNEFVLKFPEIKTMIEVWFLNYNKGDEAFIEGWEDDKKALKEIHKNKVIKQY